MAFSPFRSSLRVKLILCLMFTSLVSTAIVGGLAYRRLLQKFDDLAMQEAVQRFRGDVGGYFRTYGTWQNGLQHESFLSFNRRRRNAMAGNRVGLEGLPGDRRLPPPQPGPGPQGWEENPQDQARRPEGGQGPFLPPLDEPRARPQSRLSLPPFRFYLFDTGYRALVRLEPYEPGEPVHGEDRARLLPVEVDGQVVAYFSPKGRVNYSDLDLGYLDAMRESLVLGMAAGGVLTLVLGLLFGTGLSRSLRRLTGAVQAMGQGELRQQVAVQSNDEVGVLATAFNRMSQDLADQYEELRASNERIEEMAEQLRELSMRDALTGLYNRRHFDEQCGPLFQRAQRYGRPLCMVMADIDRFKRINDDFSHAVGDEVLRRIGGILKTTLRATDLVARYGGEEFAIALPETPVAQALEACEALRLRIEAHPWHELDPALRVTMSLGIACDAQLSDFHAMLAAADKCLYQAKDGGRNRVVAAPLAVSMLPPS